LIDTQGDAPAAHRKNYAPLSIAGFFDWSWRVMIFGEKALF
jgi:hypothetical protein